ncbi:MaoC family dehydratase [Nitratireductor sp. ZSWI3]|uniref:MaoC family dehydratase n=1 Tax=Nitratireductor sp. ZSWI3 TaxID=2966359 RepID=UPI00214FE286|nr:MaoC family dehydratase [Nitratireductor sp. ZSWI3]MCR4267974.1 MaoC family dehydratase [Nitratireductor sp. ZSWI3]
MNAHVLEQEIGNAVTISGWVTVDQEMIDRFADCTNDHQWIHVDRQRAAHEGPFGATVAHGFLTLSLLSSLSYESGAWPARLGTIINYGLDRLRFLAPVKAGSRVRLRAQLQEIEEKAPGRLLIRHHSEVEIEGEDRPALAAETVVLLVLEEPAG